MAIQIKHPFVSAKGDGGDATLVRPSNWNAAHTTSMATLSILGRLTAGSGSFEELPTSAFMIAALASTTAEEFLTALGIGGFKTGDAKFSIDPTAEAGWIAYNGEGTISKSGAGGTVLASATAQPLYEIIYNNIIDTWCPVSGGRTGNAVNDFNAGKTIALPRFSGRAVIGAGTGATLTARVAGAYAGVESVALSIAQLPIITPAGTITNGAITIVNGTNTQIATGGNSDGGGGGGSLVSNSPKTISATQATSTFAGTSFGSGSTHDNMTPYIPLWAKVKL